MIDIKTDFMVCLCPWKFFFQTFSQVFPHMYYVSYINHVINFSSRFQSGVSQVFVVVLPQILNSVFNFKSQFKGWHGSIYQSLVLLKNAVWPFFWVWFCQWLVFHSNISYALDLLNYINHLFEMRIVHKHLAKRTRKKARTNNSLNYDNFF